jgi:hypothetical protein
MRESLSLDAWRPIIASALVYRTLSSKIARKRAPLLLVPLVLFTILGIFLTYLTGTTFVAIVPFILFFVVFIVVMRGDTPLFYQSNLEADRVAAGVIGRDMFLSVLRKIDSMKMPDVEKAKHPGFDRRRAVNPIPNITDRISNLEHLSA